MILWTKVSLGSLYYLNDDWFYLHYWYPMLNNVKFSGRREGKSKQRDEEKGCGIMNSAREVFVPLLSIVVGTLIAAYCRYFSPTAQFTPIPSKSF